MVLFLKGPRRIQEVSDEKREEALINVFYSTLVMEDYASFQYERNSKVRYRTVVPELHKFGLFTEAKDEVEYLENTQLSVDGFLWWVRRLNPGVHYGNLTVKETFDIFLDKAIRCWNNTVVTGSVEDPDMCIRYFEDTDGPEHYLVTRAVVLGLFEPLGIKRVSWSG